MREAWKVEEVINSNDFSSVNRATRTLSAKRERRGGVLGVKKVQWGKSCLEIL